MLLKKTNPSSITKPPKPLGQLQSSRGMTWIRIQEASKSGKKVYLLVRWVKSLELSSTQSVNLYQSVVTTNPEVRDFYSNIQDVKQSYPIVYDIDSKSFGDQQLDTQNFISQLMEMFGSLYLPGEKPSADLNTYPPLSSERPFDILKFRVKVDSETGWKYEYEVGEAKQKINSSQLPTIKKLMNKTNKSKAFTELNFNNYLKKLSKLAYVKDELIRRGIQESELVSGKIDNKFELSKTCAFFINPRQFQHLEKIIVDKEQQKIILSDMIKKGQSKIAVAEIDVIEDMDEADPPMC